MFSSQNQHIGWLPSLVMVPIVVWLLSAFCSKMSILGGCLHFLWFPVLFGSKSALCSNYWTVEFELLEVVWTILDLEQEFWIIWEVSVNFSYIYLSQILRHNNANIGWLLSGETGKYWIRYIYEKYRTPLRVVRYFLAHPIFSGITLKPSNIVSNLVTVTGTLTTTHAQTKIGSVVRMGSLRSKRVFPKKASSPTEFVAKMRDLRTCISLTPSLQKVWS